MGLATWPNAGLNLVDRFLLGKALSLSFMVRLYTNAVTIGPDTVTSDFTECALVGYAPVLLSPSAWTGSTIAEIATYIYPTLTFGFAAYAGGVTIRGYYVTDPATGITVVCEAFAPEYPVPGSGGSVTLDLTEILSAA